MADTKISALTVATVPLYGTYLAGVTSPTGTPVNNALKVGEFFTEQFISLTATYTTSSGSTSLQKLFNVPTNGAFNVTASTSYFFECEFDLSAMSATSGTFSFGFLGTASFTSLKYTATAVKGATSANPNMTTATVATATVITPANTNTAGASIVNGIIRVNASGTVIPAFALSIASAAVVGINSWFRLVPIGSNTLTNSGNVS